MPETNLFGVYAITNVKNGKSYIGSTINFQKRKREHWNLLIGDKHWNNKLQHSWNKHGESAFQFHILEIVDDKTKLIESEQYWLDATQCHMRNKGYNICPTAANCLGRPVSEKTREKMRKKIWSPEMRMKMSKRIRGENHPFWGKHLTSGHKAKIGAAHKGKIVSAETRAKLSKALSGKNHPNFGKPMSEEQKAKISAAHKGKIISDETRCRMGNAQRGKVMSDEAKEKISDAMKGRKLSDETIKKMSVSQQNRRKKERQIFQELQLMLF